MDHSPYIISTQPPVVHHSDVHSGLGMLAPRKAWSAKGVRMGESKFTVAMLKEDA